MSLWKLSVCFIHFSSLRWPDRAADIQQKSHEDTNLWEVLSGVSTATLLPSGGRHDGLHGVGEQIP